MASVNNVRDVIDGGCSYCPKRGNFIVAVHIRADEGGASKLSGHSAVYLFVLVIVVTFHMLF